MNPITTDAYAHWPSLPTTIDCTALLTALLLRAARDAISDSCYAIEARVWLASDGMALASSLGVDTRLWLRQPAITGRISAKRIARISL